MLPKIRFHQLPQMPRRVFSLSDGVRSIGVGHHRKLLVVLDQLVDQLFRRLIMAVVVTRAVN